MIASFGDKNGRPPRGGISSSFLLGLFPVLALLGLVAGLWLFPPSLVIFEPRFLLPIFNSFLFLASGLISYIAWRSYLLNGAATILWLGCGVLALGTGALAAGWLIYPFGPNVNVTIFNMAVLLAAICHTTGVLATLEDRPGEFDLGRKQSRVTLSYLAVLAVIILVVVLTLTGLMPTFFIQGKGPTVIRQYVVEWAIVLLTFSSLVIIQRFFRKRTRFLYWYSLSLVLVAIAMLAFFLQAAVGSLIGWAGRSSYVLAAIYFLISVNSALQEARTRGTGLSEAFAEIFGPGLYWQDILATVDDAVVSYDCTGRILLWNKAAEKIFGYPEGGAKGKSIDLILPNPKVLEVSGLTGSITEIELLRRNGSRFNAEISVSSKDSALGAITNLVIRDISERRQAELALRESESRLDLALRSSEMGVWYLDLVENKRFFDDQVCRLLGIDPAEFTGTAEEFFNAIHPQDREAVKSALARSIEHGVPYEPEYRTIWPDGSIHHITARGKLVYDNEGRPIRLNGLIWDITARKRAEEALRESEAQLRTIFDNLTEGVVVSTLDGKLLTWNRAAMEMHGYSSLDEVRRPLAEFPDTFELLTMGGEVLSLEQWPLSRILRGEQLRDLEVRVRRRHSDWERITNYSGALVRDQEGTPLLAIVSMADITARKQAEEALQERTAELEFANRELEAFSYSVSHDLKTPVRAIDGFSRMLLGEHAGQLDAEGFRLLNVITDNTKLMGAMIDDLLGLSRLGCHAIKKSEVDLAAMAGQVFNRLSSQESGRDLQFILKELPRPFGDQSLLNQIMVNLLGNAIKYTRPRKTAVIEVGGKIEGNETIHYVKDNGVGFDERYAGKLYGVFHRLHKREEYEGTGVGLAIVKRIVERHDGRVWAEGKVNEGATFYFALPKKVELSFSGGSGINR